MMGRELLPLHRRRELAQDGIAFGRFPPGEGVLPSELEDPWNLHAAQIGSLHPHSYAALSSASIAAS
jgi:hypothetical protein